MPIFPNSSDFTVTGGHFTEVHGDSYVTFNLYFLGGGDDGVELTTVKSSGPGVSAESAASLNRLTRSLATQAENRCSRTGVGPNTVRSFDSDTSECGPERTPFSTFDVGIDSTSFQVALFLDTKHPVVKDGTSQRIKTSRVAWQVFDMEQTGVEITLTSPILIGFGSLTLSEDGKDATSPQFILGPSGSLVLLKYGYGMVWSGSTEFLPDTECLRARNQTGFPVRIAIGSYDQDSGGSQPSFRPFALTQEINDKTTLQVSPEFVLSGCITDGLLAGQVVDDVTFSNSQRLFEVSDFRPFADKEYVWKVTRDGASFRLQKP